MVLNLLDNAIRHTPPGSCVELTLREDGDRAVVEVGDDGPGIPADASGIFDRFVRGNGPSDTGRGTGTGLGLAIVSAVASPTAAASRRPNRTAAGPFSPPESPSPARPRKLLPSL